jgi:hypothetical protein
MDLLDQLSDALIQNCLEHLEDLWLMGAKPGEDNDPEEPVRCPTCGAEQCKIVAILQAIRDDVCTGRFDLHCTLCGFAGVVYGRVYENAPAGQPRGTVSLSPYHVD